MRGGWAAPDWWAVDLDPEPCGEWIGFIYGWDGKSWNRAAYEKDDGFDSVGLLNACSLESIDLLTEFAAAAPGLRGEPPSAEAIRALIAADADYTHAMLEAVVPGWDIEAGLEAARNFLRVDLS